MQMNKTQIEHFKQRVNKAVRDKMYKLKEEFPSLQDPEIEELVGIIYKGQARFRDETYMGEECSFIRTSDPQKVLLSLFEFPGQDVRKSKSELRGRVLDKINKRMSDAGEELVDSFVLREVDDPRTAVQEFKEKQIETEGERAELARLTSA